ncbi:methylmalonyl-CoA mutase [Streptomyces parvulus]|uniref:Methylmalonyl-CoA mutase n=1 Tax=Streptomyces parvulus TaxID=146923 RepID=A0A369UWX5_9ACTN|nr:methylmalonyl-CoA mutase family protein [Streptomyces parvulus]RDD85292.1 methylmalonyl-CoA mutase [Streptomyces parvulus]
MDAMNDGAKRWDERVRAWQRERVAADYERVPRRRKEFTTLSGAEVKDIYTPADVRGLSPEDDIGLPGEYPYTRGVHATMYRGRPWTIRQVAGFGQAEDTNNRYKYLLKTGQTGLSTDFDLPTLLGYDSDHEVYRREVGRIGVAIDTVADMHALFEGIPLDRISTSLTINPSAAILLAMYRVVADERGIPGHALNGTTQNDILKEYIAQNEFIFPPLPAVQLVVDTMEYGADVMPKFNPLNACGYHIRDAGATAVEEVGLTLSSALCYLEHARDRGIDLDRLAPRVSFFWDVHNNFFEEAAKLRAARRLWARLTRERLGCKSPKSWLMRAHCQTAGVSLTAQQPINNVARTAIQAMAAILGGTQSLHTNSLDEALSIPSESAIKIAVRTQQIILHETGAADVVDPLGGSYYVEALTSQIENDALELIERIDGMGGMIAAVESGYAAQLIADSAWEQQVKIESNDAIVVGVNDFIDENESHGLEIDRPIPGVMERQMARLAEVKRSREDRQVTAALRAIEQAAPDLHHNLMPLIEDAVRARATVGEICDVLRGIWGHHQPSTVF